MTIKIIIRLLSLVTVLTLSICIIFTSSGCSNNSSYINLNPPDKVNLYSNGQQKLIQKSNSTYTKINDLINQCLPDKQTGFEELQLAYSDKDLAEAKSYSVEYIYNKPQKVTIDTGIKQEFQFSEIIFPFSEHWQNTAFIKMDDGHYMPVGVNGKSESTTDLVKLLNDSM